MSDAQATGDRVQAVLEELRELPLCGPMDACNPNGMLAMAELGRIEHFAAGVEVLRAGEPATELRLVVSGRVVLCFEHAGTGIHTLGSASAGDLVGWSALREGATWTVDARTTKPTRCVTFEGTELRALCDRDRDIGYCIMRLMFEAVSQRLTDARVQLLDLYGRAG